MRGQRGAVGGGDGLDDGQAKPVSAGVLNGLPLVNPC